MRIGRWYLEVHGEGTVACTATQPNDGILYAPMIQSSNFKIAV